MEALICMQSRPSMAQLLYCHCDIHLLLFCSKLEGGGGLGQYPFAKKRIVVLLKSGKELNLLLRNLFDFSFFLLKSGMPNYTLIHPVAGQVNGAMMPSTSSKLVPSNNNGNNNGNGMKMNGNGRPMMGGGGGGAASSSQSNGHLNGVVVGPSRPPIPMGGGAYVKQYQQVRFAVISILGPKIYSGLRLITTNEGRRYCEPEDKYPKFAVASIPLFHKNTPHFEFHCMRI